MTDRRIGEALRHIHPLALELSGVLLHDTCQAGQIQIMKRLATSAGVD